MSYTALYRKWRPERFEDVKGQDAIVTTLKNQIIRDRIGHAYLFCGTRGTGKTTIAKIVAKAVNCENPADGSPCGVCTSCRAIAEGSSMNVVEMDAASNNGVDDVRLIRDEVTYAPTEGRYKVYIIDEAHNLSSSAFNALLKTLEEPPSYVIFILATTEYHKIPVTILSRCQRYDFKRISVDTIVERLHELMEGEGIEAEEKALKYIAKIADGGLRDALSLFDQCSSFYYGQKLTYDMVLEVLGAVDTKVFSDLLCAVMARDIKSSVDILGNVVTQGRELNQFVIDFTWYLRNLLLVKTSEEEDNIDEVLDMSSENLEQLKREASAIDLNRIMRYIRIFSGLSNDIKYATQKRILIEIAIIKLCRPDMETDTDSLQDRIRAIEEKLEKGITAAAAEALPVSSGTGDRGDLNPAVKAAPMPKALPEDIKKIAGGWMRIIASTHNPIHSYLKRCTPSVSEEGRLIIATYDETVYEYLSREISVEEIGTAMENYTGKTVDYELVKVATKEELNENYHNIAKGYSNINMDIVTDDCDSDGF